MSSVNVNVSELIQKLLAESFVGRVDNLEKRFQREGDDLASLDVTTDSLKKTLKSCEIMMEAALASAEIVNRATTEPGANSGKPAVKGREKSAGKSAGKSLGNTSARGDKGLTRGKTVTNLTKVDENGNKSMSKVKSTKELAGAKTPRAAKTPAKPSGLSPDKGKLGKTLTKAATQANLNDTKTSIKKNPTAKGDMKGLTKSATKPNLAKTAEKPGNKNKGEAAISTKGFDINESEKTHPKREDNISATIGVGLTTNDNDELLTKEDTLIPEITQVIKEVATTVTEVAKIDYNDVLDDRWSVFSKYFNKFDHVKIFNINKIYGKLCITHLISNVQKEIIENEGKIKTIRDKSTPEDLNKEQNAFALTRGALKAVELLNESLYFKLFTEGPVPVDDILLTYRIFFQLLKLEDYVKISSQEEFWNKACEYFINESHEKLGTMVLDLSKSIDFSNENIYKINRLLGTDITKITPSYYSKLCGTTGLFIFLIKDALEYAGILVDKKTPPSRLYKNYMYNFEVLQAKIERLKKIQTTYFTS